MANNNRHSANFKDLTNQTFGFLTVVEYVETKNWKPLWRCQCECGGTRITSSHSLKCGYSTTCGCGLNKRTQSDVVIKGDTATVSLTMGEFATIDSADVHLVSGRRWHCLVSGKTKYAIHSVRGRLPLAMHRVVLGVTDSSIHIDHCDGNGLNNRRRNIRLCTIAQNQHNTGRQTNNTSGFKGVHFSRGKWVARISVNGTRINLGRFGTAAEASEAYRKAALEYHKEFAAW